MRVRDIKNEMEHLKKEFVDKYDCSLQDSTKKLKSRIDDKVQSHLLKPEP